MTIEIIQSLIDELETIDHRIDIIANYENIDWSKVDRLRQIAQSVSDNARMIQVPEKDYIVINSKEHHLIAAYLTDAKIIFDMNEDQIIIFTNKKDLVLNYLEYQLNKLNFKFDIS